jgi:hypothetical protein
MPVPVAHRTSTLPAQAPTPAREHTHGHGYGGGLPHALTRLAQVAALLERLRYVDTDARTRAVERNP